ncbi:MAG: hypothetical protein PT119_18605 [Aphanizomenon gracile PMC627.10]|nr:hypothetical protein [Aphanizomenon gracile PMC627.10]
MIVIQKRNAYQKHTFEQKTLLRGAFNKIDLEIGRIRFMLKEQKGFLFFKSHVYSKETLFNELHHGKILKIVDNVNNLAVIWNRHGVLTRDGIKFFEFKHKEIHRELEKLQHEIEKRDGTWWEKISGAFREFISFIKEHIPQFAVGFLMEFAKYPALQPFISFLLPSPQLSSAETRLIEEAIGDYIDVNVTTISSSIDN